MTTKPESQKDSTLRLIEKRKHPRFLLTNEQFRETKSGKIFPVYDISVNGLAIKVDEQYWKPGAIIQGVLNLHPDSIEISPRLLGYYADRAALKIESVSTYAKSVLDKNLSPRRLGQSLQLIKEKLPLADFWFHGVCNTDVLIRMGSDGHIHRADLFFANFYWGWNSDHKAHQTGICQSFGADKREPIFLSEEPVRMESIEIDHDKDPDPKKLEWALKIIESSPMQSKLKDAILAKMK